MKYLAAVLSLSVFLVCCAKPPELTREEIKTVIIESDAFQSPIDPGIIFVDTHFQPGPDTKREILRVEGAVVKDDDPFGMAGKTATVAFTWQWTEGPFAGRTMRCVAKLNSTGERWHVYEDILKNSLYAAERGESQE